MGQFERLSEPGRIDLPALHSQQAVTDSPAPRAARQGAWRARAPLPIPRTEMAWAVAYRERVHLVGGYAEQRVDKPYHHAYDPTSDRWEELPQLPRGANHVGWRLAASGSMRSAASSNKTARRTMRPLRLMACAGRRSAASPKRTARPRAFR